MSPPPRPRLSALAQTVRFMRDPFALLAATRAECGDLFSLRLLGLGRWVFLCSAEHLHELYKLPEDQVVAGEIRQELVGYLFGAHGSLGLDGEEYSRRRRVVTPYFAGQRLLEHTGLIRELTEAKLERWRPGDALALQPTFDLISLEVTARILFGPLDRPPAEELVPLARRFLEALHSPLVQARPLQWNLGRWTPWGRFVAARRELGDAIGAAVRARQENGGPDGDPGDVLQALVAAGLYEDPEESRRAIVDELVSFVVGGAETTAKVLSWTLLGVLANPEVHRRLRRELDEVLDGEPIDNGDLRKLPYLHAVTQEGMRFQAVGPFAGPRLAKKDIRLGGYTIPAGTRLAHCLPEVGRGDVFPNPGAFDPENFLASGVKQRDWVPFGGGTRMCTGMGLAQLELAVITGTLVQRLDLELGAGPTAPKQAGIAFQPANGLEVRILGKR